MRAHGAPLVVPDVGDDQHVGAVRIEFEPVRNIFAQHRRRKGTETLAVFDLEVEVLLHRGRTGIAEDRACAERTRAEFHPALKPADRKLVGQRLRRRLDHLVFTQHRKTRADRGEPSLDLTLRELRTEKRARHPIVGSSAARLALKLMVGCERSTNRAAGITGRRLNPNPVELAVAQHLAVGDAIERHAPRKTEVASAGLTGEAARQPQHRFVEHRLNGGGNIHVERGQQLIGRAHRLAEQFCKPFIRHGEAGAIIEIGHVEPERSIRLQIDEVIENELRVFRLAVRREPHHLIFAGVDLEAGEVGHGRIKQTKRMRKVNLLEDLKTVALTQSGRCRRPFTDTIHGENHGLVERRRIEGRGRMAQMMFGEK